MTARPTTRDTRAESGSTRSIRKQRAATAGAALGGAATQLCADCTADRAGGLTFDVRLPQPAAGQTPATAVARTADAALLLRHGGDAGECDADAVRLPLTPVAPGGPLRAALPSTMSLPEGRWDAYFAAGGSARPLPLLPGTHDLRSLVDRTPRPGRTWLGVRIPHTAPDGRLTVRAWLRWPHAEVGELAVGRHGMVLHGRLYGTGLAPGAELVAEARALEGERVAVPVTCDSRDTGAEGAGFCGSLPYARLVRSAVWDLLLHPGEGGAPVRVARILDDVPDKKRALRYPAREVPGACGVFTVQPYYTRDNDLSLQVTPASGEPEPVAA